MLHMGNQILVTKVLSPVRQRPLARGSFKRGSTVLPQITATITNKKKSRSTPNEQKS